MSGRCDRLGGFEVEDCEIDLGAAFVGVVAVPDAPVTGVGSSPDWGMLRLRGGAHDGEAHLCPIDVQQWVCGGCGAAYALTEDPGSPAAAADPASATPESPRGLVVCDVFFP